MQENWCSIHFATANSPGIDANTATVFPTPFQKPSHVNQFDKIRIKDDDNRRFGPFSKPKPADTDNIGALFHSPFSKKHIVSQHEKKVIHRTNAKFRDFQTHNNSQLLSRVDQVTVCIFKFSNIENFIWKWTRSQIQYTIPYQTECTDLCTDLTLYTSLYNLVIVQSCVQS